MIILTERHFPASINGWVYFYLFIFLFVLMFTIFCFLLFLLMSILEINKTNVIILKLDMVKQIAKIQMIFFLSDHFCYVIFLES